MWSISDIFGRKPDFLMHQREDEIVQKYQYGKIWTGFGFFFEQTAVNQYISKLFHHYLWASCRAFVKASKQICPDQNFYMYGFQNNFVPLSTLILSSIYTHFNTLKKKS